MKVCLTTALLTCVLLCRTTALEPGFEPLLDSAHAAAWTHVGPGGMQLVNGEATLSSPKRNGFSWYTKQSYADFVLKLEFRGLGREFNSGVFIRFRNPGSNAAVPTTEGNEVAIVNASSSDQKTGSIYNFKEAAAPRLHADWNEMEITATGNRVVVNVNGKVVNDFTGLRQPAGYIALQAHPMGPVQFRNLRIRDLSSTTPAAIPPPLPNTVLTESNQPRIQVIKDQGPNAMEWVLMPLGNALPGDIRQNLTYLREDLLDESKKAPKASAAAYALGYDYCDKLLAALGQREIASVNAGYRAAQADASKAISNQALSARRNYQMSWPQYAREEAQRAALRENETDKADVKKERLKVEWATRAEQMRQHLDTLYRQLREAMR